MKVKVVYYGQARSFSGREEEELEIAGDDVYVEGLLRLVAERYGNDMRQLCFKDDGTPRRSLLISINDRAVDDFSTQVREGDVVAVIPAVAGG